MIGGFSENIIVAMMQTNRDGNPNMKKMFFTRKFGG